MAGKSSYEFNAHDDKIYEITTDSEPLHKKETLKESNNTRVPFIILIVLQLLILSFLIVLTAITVFGIVDNDSDSVNCPTTTTAAPDALRDSQTCNTTVITETFKMSQHINDLLQEIQFQNSTGAIMRLLQEMHSEQQIFYENSTDVLRLLMENSENSLLKLMNIIGTLSNHRETSISAAAIIDDILIVVKELLQLQNASVLFNSVTPVSCKDIKGALPASPSGYYHVNSRYIYCNMEELCGSSGGWTRVAYLDMNDATQNCPDQLSLRQSGGVRTCGRSSNVASCSSPTKFSTNGLSYNEVCGKVIGYEFGSPDAILKNHHPNDINSHYVDGISITRGSPRQHVWTFMAGLYENYYAVYNCPCNEPPGDQEIFSFIGSNYFCEAGNPTTYWNWQQVLYTSDPLWDSEGCGSQEQKCCAAEGLPWFHRQYDNATTDFLELRICGDESSLNEDNPINYYEIYIK